MINSQKRCRRDGRRKTTKKDDAVLKNVVSLRISDKEKQVLEKITKKSSKNVSEVVREAIEFWLATRQRPCLES